jgi:hypothetical protein
MLGPPDHQASDQGMHGRSIAAPRVSSGARTRTTDCAGSSSPKMGVVEIRTEADMEQDVVGYEHDIRPLFREKDVSEMS